MIKNDYRRAFIMLRPAAAGYGGHARLERRTLSGSLYFIVTAPEGAGPLAAALVGRQGGDYTAAVLGTFTRDRRGQLTLAVPFDPRAIDGRPLEAYWWVAVADAASGATVLTGNVDGSHEVDPAALERAVRAALVPVGGAPAAGLPEPGEPEPDPESDVKIYRSRRVRAAEAVSANAEVSPPPAPLPGPEEVSAEVAPPPMPEEVPAEVAPPPMPLPGPEVVLAEIAPAPGPEEVPAEAAPLPMPLPSPEVVLAEVAPAPMPEEGPAEAAEIEAGQCEPPRAVAPPQTAAQALGLDITAPWIEPAEPLRRLFAIQAPAEAPLAADGFVYVATMLPRGGDCLTGLRAANGRITGIRYALPGAYAPEPPAGLEDYAWNDAGYWVLDIGVS